MKRFTPAIIFISLLIVAIVSFAITVGNTPAPHITENHGQTQIDIQASSGWILSPSGCTTMSWAVDSIQGLYINGNGQIGQGTLDYCPAIDLVSPQFDVIDSTGVHRRVTLDIQYLPDLISYLAGFVGIGFTVAYTSYMLIVHTPNKPFPIVEGLCIIVLLAMIGTALRLSASPTVPINITSDTLSLQYQAEHNNIVFPDECVTVTWSVTGAKQILFNGVDVTEQGNPATGTHCASDGNNAELTIIDNQLTSKTYSLPIPSIFPHLTHTTVFAILSIVGLILSGIVFLSLLYQKLKDAIHNKRTSDLLVMFGFFVFVLMLYLPFGFESIGHWEEWVISSYISGKSGDLIASEMVSRYWVIVPHTLAYLISSDSFVGFHLINFGMFFGKMVLLYAILRRLNLSHNFAFLATLLFMVYPVNTGLMSLRSFPMQFSALTLLIAVYLVLDYRQAPSRLKLIGIWWGLAFNIFSNESAYMIILALPLLWWLSDRKLSWKNFNLTAIWYLYPAYKIALLLLLSTSNRAFYQSAIISGTNGNEQATPSMLTIFQRTMGTLYRITFVDSWGQAVSTISNNAYLPIVAVLLVMTAGIVFWISRQQEAQDKKHRYLVTLISGLLLMMPSVGVLMWIPLYRGDLWRMYFYIPIAATLTISGLVFFFASFIRHKTARNGLITLIFIILMFPSTTRLLLQHEQYTTSAHNKATVLYHLVNLAPQINPETHILLTTDLSREALEALGMFEFIRRDMFNSALYMLYEDARPQFAYFCLEANVCSNFPYEETIFTSSNPEELLQRTLVFTLHDDLSVEVVNQPAERFGLDIDLDGYDPESLYRIGSLPKRVNTMLRGHDK
jgi:hypothetical protein